MTLAEKEKQVQTLIAQDQKDAAVKLLFELIVEYARSKNFEKAEMLRDKLMEVDAMALTEIIQAGDIIDAEKSEAIDLDHKKIWSELYQGFSEGEGNAFYFALKEAKLQSDKTIIEQGRHNDKLFFINDGQLKVICLQGDREIFLKNISAGTITGYSTFFPISLATTSVVTLEPVNLNYLERKKLSKIVEEFPGFEAKLESLCSKLVTGKSEDILKQKDVERRVHERFSTQGKVTTRILNAKGEPASTPFFGGLEDLSRGGASYSIKCSKKETARMLLGRSALLNIESKTGDKGPVEPQKGLVVSVQYQMFNDYIIHFKFYSPLSVEKLKKFV